jgi:hypothetical protein
MRVGDQQRDSAALSWEEDPVPIIQGPGWVLVPVYMGAEKFHRVLNPEPSSP